VDYLSLVNQEIVMPRTRPAYAPEFKAQMVELARSGRPLSALAREFEPSLETIRNWVRQADLDDGLRKDGLTSRERDEVRELRRENRRLKQERDILAKAAAWFARETGSVPPTN
jgi:transposase